MSDDILDILRRWRFSPEQNVRKIIDASGREKIQVRVDQGAFQGVLQMELDGRPDGERPFGFEFYLDYYQHSRDRFVERTGSDKGFALSPKSCKRLFRESRRVYERYVFLLQISDYKRVIRDTERNMEVFRFVHRYAEQDDDRHHLLRWWPYVLRMNVEAQLVPLLSNEQVQDALSLVRDAERRIHELDEVEAEEFFVERDRSLRYLGDMVTRLKSELPSGPDDHLQNELIEAILEEHFERAAEIRDRLRELNALPDISSTLAKFHEKS
ncbi:MAG: putative transcriptional regulator [Rhodothermales bacterium]|jgi:predicted transcriptional regulator